MCPSCNFAQFIDEKNIQLTKKWKDSMATLWAHPLAINTARKSCEGSASDWEREWDLPWSTAWNTLKGRCGKLLFICCLLVVYYDKTNAKPRFGTHATTRRWNGSCAALALASATSAQTEKCMFLSVCVHTYESHCRLTSVSLSHSWAPGKLRFLAIKTQTQREKQKRYKRYKHNKTAIKKEETTASCTT